MAKLPTTPEELELTELCENILTYSYFGQRMARRRKGKLYKVNILGNRRYTQHHPGVFIESDVGTTGWKRMTPTGSFNAPFHIPEGSVVLYLKSMNKNTAQVLFKETICTIPRADLAIKPITE